MNVVPVVAACIVREGKVYLTLRRRSKALEAISKFEFPGGKVEGGETFKGALVREIKEELGWDISVSKLLHAQINSYSTGGLYLILFYLCYKLDEKQKADPEAKLVWLKPEEVKYWGTLPGTAEAAEELCEKYTEVLERYEVEQAPEFTARVLSYEIGDIHKLLIYHERLGPSGYLGDLKIACADALTMIGLLGEQLGYNLDELKEEGLERFRDRIREVHNGKNTI